MNLEVMNSVPFSKFFLLTITTTLVEHVMELKDFRWIAKAMYNSCGNIPEFSALLA